MKILLLSNMIHTSLGGSENYNGLLYEYFPEFQFYELPFIKFDVNKNTAYKNVIVLRDLCDVVDKLYIYFSKKSIMKNSILKRILNLIRNKKSSKIFLNIVSNLINEYEFDHIIMSTSYFYNKKFINKYKDKIIFIQHQNPYVYLNYYYFDSEKTKKFQKFNVMKLIMGGVHYFLTFNFFKYVKKIVCYDDINASIIYSHYKRLLYPISLPSDFVNIEYHSTIKKYDFIFPSRIVSEKNVEDLLKFTEKYNEYKFFICGEGDQKYLFSDKKNVILKDTLNKKELIDKYKESKFLISFSPLEGFSFIIVEALSCGIPCIVANSYPSAEFLVGKNSERGLLFDLDDPDRFEKIHDFVSNCDYDKLSLNAYEFAKEKFDTSIFIKKWKELLTKKENLISFEYKK